VTCLPNVNSTKTW